MPRSESDPAYEPEAQAYGVFSAEREGRLTIVRGDYSSRQRVRQEQLEWVLFSFMYERTLCNAALLGIDCDADAMQGLRWGSPVVVIQDQIFQPKVFDGRDLKPVAAVMTGSGKVIYRSRIFNLEKFIQEYRGREAKPNKTKRWFL